MDLKKLTQKYETDSTVIKLDKGYICGSCIEEPKEDELKYYVGEVWGNEILEVQIYFEEKYLNNTWHWNVDVVLDEPED